MKIKSLLIAAVSSVVALPASAAVVVTFENPGVQETTAVFDFVGVERFEDFPTGTGQNVNTTFGGSDITGAYSNLEVNAANQFGSAGGVGKHAVARGGQPGFDLRFTTTRPEGVNYFGYWLSALDRGNQLEFYNGDTLVFSFTPEAVIGRIGACPDAGNLYCGNPTGAFQGQNAREPYAFVNIFFTAGQTFDRVRFFEDPRTGNYESDNHTIGLFNTITGNPVPEPATWAMLIAGFGMVGHAARRRRRIAAA